MTSSLRKKILRKEILKDALSVLFDTLQAFAGAYEYMQLPPTWLLTVENLLHAFILSHPFNVFKVFNHIGFEELMEEEDTRTLVTILESSERKSILLNFWR